jgi:adenosine deaminase
MFELARTGIEFIFAGDEVKQDLVETFDSAAKKLNL